MFSVLVTFLIKILSSTLNLWGASVVTVASRLAVVIPVITLGFLFELILVIVISSLGVIPVVEDSWRT